MIHPELLLLLLLARPLAANTDDVATSCSTEETSMGDTKDIKDMDAIVVETFGGPDVLQLKRVPIPTPKSGQVLVKLFAAGVNPVETYLRSGAYHWAPERPYIPGAEGAGIVAAVGPNVTSFKVSDKVFVTRTADSRHGTYAQFCVSNEDQVYPLPSTLTYEQGAAIGIAYYTAYRALFIRTRTKPGSIVMVHGASGGVGLACVHLAKWAGATVIGTSSAAGKDTVLKAGASQVFDHSKEGYMSAIKAATPGGRGVDTIVEMLANVNLAKDLKILARGGVVAVVGNRGTVDNVNARDLMLCEGSVVGVLGGTPEERKEGYLGTLAAIASGVRPVVGVTFPLKDASSAHKEVIAHAMGTKGKIVLQMDS